MMAAFVEQPAGAFFMFRRSAWLELGGFDENFWPVWFEDVDFCARLRSAGYSGQVRTGGPRNPPGRAFRRENSGGNQRAILVW
jgi:hypothetical protein